MKYKKKLRQLAHQEGYAKVKDLLAAYLNCSVVPSVCISNGCKETALLGRDTTEGWCDNCGEHSMISCLKMSHIL